MANCNYKVFKFPDKTVGNKQKRMRCVICHHFSAHAIERTCTGPTKWTQDRYLGKGPKGHIGQSIHGR